MTDINKELAEKLNSNLYKLSKITRDTAISRYWLNRIKDGGEVPSYISVALKAYFDKIGD